MAEAATTQEESIIRQFFDTADNFMNHYNYIQAEMPKLKGTPLEGEAQALLIEGEQKRSLIDNTKGALDSVIDWAGTTWGNLTDWAKENVPGLGILPAVLWGATISISAVSAAVATMVMWIKKAEVVALKIEQYNKLVDQGIAPLEASKIANDLIKADMPMAMTDKLMMFGVFGIAGFLLFNFMKMKR